MKCINLIKLARKPELFESNFNLIIKICLKELIEQIEIITEITVEKKNHRINFKMGGDLKWLATVYGLNAANSNYPCPWCFWKNEPLTNNDLSKNWPINQRKIQSSNDLIKKKSTDEKKGQIKDPLFKFIDFDQCVVDVLHLFLRVTDKLFRLLLNRLEQLDTIFSGYKSGKIENMKMTKIFLDFLQSCKITAPFYVKVQEKVSKYKLRKLNKNEK